MGRWQKIFKSQYLITNEGVLKGTVCLKINGYRMQSSEELYSEKRPEKLDAELVAIPYYAWANRGENQMRVWLPEE